MGDTPNHVPLSEVLANIAEELSKANQAAKERGFAPMKFAECELDFAVQIEKEGSGGLKVWVLHLGGGVTRSNSNTIKIKLSANPEEKVVAVVRAAGPAQKPSRQPTRKARG